MGGLILKLFISALNSDAAKKVIFLCLQKIVENTETKMDDKALAYIVELVEVGCQKK